MAQIDIDKFVISLMRYFGNNKGIVTTLDRCLFSLGLKYVDTPTGGRLERVDQPTILEKIMWKSGEQKPDIIIPKFRVGDTIRIKNSDAEYTITDISDGCYRGKGWCLDIAAGDKCGDYELVENKPAGWSKVDERDFDVIYGIIYNSCNAEDASRLIEWLKVIKDRVQPKHEWGEEDEKMFSQISDILWEGYKNTTGEMPTWDNIREWCLSIKDRIQHQTTWKPSDEQLDSLYDVLNPCDGFNREVLESLYVQLKKLREE